MYNRTMDHIFIILAVLYGVLGYCLRVGCVGQEAVEPMDWVGSLTCWGIRVAEKEQMATKAQTPKEIRLCKLVW